MHTPIKHIFLLSSIALIVSGCATLNKNECLTANWENIGYEDGTKGYKASRIGQHRSACSEHGVSPDLNAYNTGRKNGLHHYCTPATAYKKGLSGYSYNGVCAGYNERVFLAAFNHGQTVYKAKRRLAELKNTYAEEERYIIQLERELHEKEHLIVSGRLSKVKALILLNETKEIAEELGRTKSNLDQLAHEINEQAQHVEYLKNQRG